MRLWLISSPFEDRKSGGDYAKSVYRHGVGPSALDACAQIGNSAGWSPNTQTEKAGVPSANQSNYQDHLFAQIAAVGGLAEVDLGKLVASKAVDPGVKRFAERMVDDHEKANVKLKSIAQKSNIALPTTSMLNTVKLEPI